MWALIIIFPIFTMQLIHVRVYGESEYWFAMIKVIMVILFIIVGLIYNWGGVIGHPGPGLSNFHDGQAFIGGFSAFAQTFALAFYSYGGVELVSLAAGETKSPHKAIPRAIKATFFRVVLFYILTDADSQRDHVLGFFSKVIGAVEIPSIAADTPPRAGESLV